MAYWPDVTRGEKVQHHMLLENNLRHMINSLDGFGSNPTRGYLNGVVRIPIWNASSSAFSPGQAVAFDSKKNLCGDAVPAVPVTDNDKPWGVCERTLEVNGIGECIISGPATVALTGSSGDYAEPDGTGFKRSSSGIARILYAKTQGNNGVILLGGGGADMYSGPFAVTYDEEEGLIHVSSGYLNANGQWFEVDEAEISPQTGVICVNCELNEGEWTSPEITFDTPGTNSFPIGRCTVNDDSVEVESFHTPVAIIIETTTCPYDEGGGGGGGDDPI